MVYADTLTSSMDEQLARIYKPFVTNGGLIGGQQDASPTTECTGKFTECKDWDQLLYKTFPCNICTLTTCKLQISNSYTLDVCLLPYNQNPTVKRICPND